MIPHRMEAEVMSWTMAVERGQVKCGLERCPRCEVVTGGFKLHATCRRQFLVIVDRLVKQILSALTRWMCPCCGKTFTTYPAFALPYKRYVIDDIRRLALGYVDHDTTTYRQAVKVRGMATCYDSGQAVDDPPADDRVLSPSTLHRWLGWLGNLKQTSQQAWRLIRAKSACCNVFRHTAAVAAIKYQTDARRIVLQNCHRLLEIDQAYRNLFDLSIFTDLATACRWR